MKVIFLSWSKYHSRTERLAKSLGATVRYVWLMGRVRLPLLPLKYLLQTIDTFLILLRERPDVVVAQTPPVFVALISLIYSSLTRTRFIVDAHSGSFLSPKWRWSYRLHQWCSSHAQITIVHVEELKRLLQREGIQVIEAGYVGNAVPDVAPYPLPDGFNVVVPSSFGRDEPTEDILAAARVLPRVNFHITGDERRLPRRLLKIKPENVRFTGYLPIPSYFGLLINSDAVLVLTTDDYTFQCGAEEAVIAGNPIITSNSRSLQRSFRGGAVFVERSPESIAAGIRECRDRFDGLKHEVGLLKGELDRTWELKCQELVSIIWAPDRDGTSAELESGTDFRMARGGPGTSGQP